MTDLNEDVLEKSYCDCDYDCDDYDDCCYCDIIIVAVIVIVVVLQPNWDDSSSRTNNCGAISAIPVPE